MEQGGSAGCTSRRHQERSCSDQGCSSGQRQRWERCTEGRWQRQGAAAMGNTQHQACRDQDRAPLLLRYGALQERLQAPAEGVQDLWGRWAPRSCMQSEKARRQHCQCEGRTWSECRCEDVGECTVCVSPVWHCVECWVWQHHEGPRCRAKACKGTR